MEQGSLLQHALSQSREKNGLKNTLVVDAFSLMSHSLEHLANTAVRWNALLLESDYPWLSPPLQFGMHCTCNILHLRAHCVYGASIADEWKAIQLMLELTSQDEQMVVTCWDLDDGQVILIQAADVLPDWVDEVDDSCRYRCWIKKGQVQLLEPLLNDDRDSQLSLSEALQRFKDDRAVKTSAKILSVISSTVKTHDTLNSWHKTVVALPESTARLLGGNPRLLHHCIGQLQRSEPAKPTTKISSSDLVWLPLRLGRTAYAMLAANALDQNDAQEQQESGQEHLKGAVSLGKALENAYRQTVIKENQTKQGCDDEKTRRRCWQELAENSNLSSAWLDEHHKHVDSCPVFDPELQRPPTIATIIKDLTTAVAPSYFQFSNPPGPEYVDNTDWMEFPSTSNQTDGMADLDGMLTGVQSFIGTRSTVQGVERKLDASKVIQLLHVSLKAATSSELESWLQRDRDPFFSREDYDLLDPEEDDDASMDTDENGEPGIEDAMEAMDEELKSSHSKPIGADHAEGSVHVLSNLLRSLEAGAGASGPVQNLLSQTGQSTPVVTSLDFDETGDA